jgi:hypothetical protein
MIGWLAFLHLLGQAHKASITTGTPVKDAAALLYQAMTHDGQGPRPMAIAMTVTPAEQDHIDAIRRASVEHAVARGHLRRG